MVANVTEAQSYTLKGSTRMPAVLTRPGGKADRQPGKKVAKGWNT